MTGIPLTPEDAHDQVIPFARGAVPLSVGLLFAPWGAGHAPVFVVQLSDGIAVEYADGKKRVFRPEDFDGRVTGTFRTDPAT